VQAGVVYAREYREETPTGRSITHTVSLMASGNLWRDALVMYDRQTKSLWTQHDGRAIQGRSQEAGRQLEALASEKMTYAQALERYPSARVLKKKAGFLGNGTESIYDDYLARDDQFGLFGTEVPTDEIGGKELVLGVVMDQPYAFSVPALVVAGGRNLELDGGTFFAVPLADGQDARLWATDRLLGVESAWVLSDPAGTARWDAGTGKALSPATADLQRVEARVQAWFAWYPDHPQSSIWAGDKRE
jgi:hypothetical protein